MIVTSADIATKVSGNTAGAYAAGSHCWYLQCLLVAHCGFLAVLLFEHVSYVQAGVSVHVEEKHMQKAWRMCLPCLQA